jgi:hypothetical protein
MSTEDLTLFGMSAELRVDMRNPATNQPVPMLRLRIDPRCLSYSVGRDRPTTFEVNHYKPRCGCGAGPEQPDLGPLNQVRMGTNTFTDCTFEGASDGAP